MSVIAGQKDTVFPLTQHDWTIQASAPSKQRQIELAHTFWALHRHVAGSLQNIVINTTYWKDTAFYAISPAACIFMQKVSLMSCVLSVLVYPCVFS